MLAYCFLIPLVPLLKDVSDLNLSKDQIELVITGVSHYGMVTAGSKVIESIVKSILNRFKTADNDSRSDQ
jgi:hypothetical protein